VCSIAAQPALRGASGLQPAARSRRPRHQAPPGNGVSRSRREPGPCPPSRGPRSNRNASSIRAFALSRPISGTGPSARRDGLRATSTSSRSASGPSRPSQWLPRSSGLKSSFVLHGMELIGLVNEHEARPAGSLEFLGRLDAPSFGVQVQV